MSSGAETGTEVPNIPTLETARDDTARSSQQSERPGEHFRLLSGGSPRESVKWEPKSMYLQTLESNKAYAKRHLRGRPTNNTADIEGAQPRQRRGRGFTSQGVSYSLQTHDIPGAQPKKLGIRSPTGVSSDKTGFGGEYKALRNPLDCSDIEGTTPKPKVFRTDRCVNPLDPTYKLASDPQSQKLPPPENNTFIRDAMDLSDIDGSRPRKAVHYQTRDPINVHDIEGASANWKPTHKRRDYNKRPEFNQMNVQDIIGKPTFTSTRQTNPLSPTYRINGMKVSDESFLPQQVKLVPGKSLERTKQQLEVGRQEPFFALHTKDIVGAQANTSGGNINNIGLIYVDDNTVEKRKRRHFRDTNSTHDIAGAETNSRKNGLRSKRQTNPLNPQYMFLNGSPRPDSPLVEPRTDRPLKPVPPPASARKNSSARRPSQSRTSLSGPTDDNTTVRGNGNETTRTTSRRASGQTRIEKQMARSKAQREKAAISAEIAAVKELPDRIPVSN